MVQLKTLEKISTSVLREVINNLGIRDTYLKLDIDCWRISNSDNDRNIKLETSRRLTLGGLPVHIWVAEEIEAYQTTLEEYYARGAPNQ